MYIKNLAHSRTEKVGLALILRRLNVVDPGRDRWTVSFTLRDTETDHKLAEERLVLRSKIVLDERSQLMQRGRDGRVVIVEKLIDISVTTRLSAAEVDNGTHEVRYGQ